jgi:hypothetical protein
MIKEGKELNDVVCTAYRMGCEQTREVYQKRVEELEAALREIAKTVTIEDESWHPSYHDFSFTQKQAEGAFDELGRRIQIARKALEGKDDGS